MAKETDLFENLLSLEDDFYREGFNLGVKDGKRAGLIDGRLFGLENGFEKYSTMGKLHGRAITWAGRLPHDVTKDSGPQARSGQAMQRLDNPRLRTSVRALYALTEPDSLSTENAENAVADFDDRLKRAEGKFKVIERITGEPSQDDRKDCARNGAQLKESGGIEDTTVLSTKH